MIDLEQVQDNVLRSLTEGVIVIGFEGTITYANHSAEIILNIAGTKMIGRKFAEVFFDKAENDEFVQAVLDAVYGNRQPNSVIVPYFAGETERKLRMVTSFFRDSDEKPAGITIVISDLSELLELKDSLKAMEQINELNRRLNVRNELLSKTFGQFLSDDIVRELLDTPGGLVPGGKKRTVTIMMSDLRGFTAMSERMEAEGLITMLNHYLESMTDAIQNRGGTIIEFIGDGILAVFGAPTASETHAGDAVAAALEMQAAMNDVNQWNVSRGYPPLEMGIGLNCGEVIVGNIGSEKRMKYGVVGSHVNLCGRIESYTTGGQVLISPNVRSRIHTTLCIEKEMTVLPKGAAEEMILSHVTGIGAPYNVQVSTKNDVTKKLREPVPIRFFRIHEKHTEDKSCYGGIVAVGSDCAVLDTEADLELFDNIQIDAGGKLFAKVMNKAEEGFVIQYTSIPSGYENWIGAHM